MNKTCYYLNIAIQRIKIKIFVKKKQFDEIFVNKTVDAENKRCQPSLTAIKKMRKKNQSILIPVCKRQWIGSKLNVACTFFQILFESLITV